MVNIGCAGVLFSVAYMKTRSLWLPFGIHFAWNFSQTTIYGFPTSGLDPTLHSLIRLTQSGPAWIVGGGFGPEGGVLATLALILGAWYVLKAPYLRAPEGIVTLDSIEDLIAKKGVPS
jgi:membrane protease YdiL (CAAX protease family)